MNVLGIETSCDETGVALYNTERGLLADALHSQIAMHERYGGVVPELASRDHIQRVLPLTEEVLHKARLKLEDVNAVAYTAGPGLSGALLVGASVATALAFSRNIPAIAVHHLEGHVLSPLLSTDPPEFPFIALLVSGGHTQLFYVASLGSYELLGESIDDAAGEAFDKSAKLLGLGYPGGPAIARAADEFLEMGIKNSSLKLPRPMLHSGDLNMSFSGLKTSVLTAVNKAKNENALDNEKQCLIAHEVQEAITDLLTSKAKAALERTGAKRLVISGGVSANQRLRQKLDLLSQRNRVRIYFPELALCTDNGAMIAFAGAMRLKHETGVTALEGFTVKPRWPLSDLKL